MDKPPSLLGLDRTTKPLIRLSLLLLWQWVYICGKAKSKSMSDSTGSLSRLNPSSQRTGWLKTGGAEYGARTSSAKPTNGINQSFVRKRRIKPRSSQAPSGRAGKKWTFIKLVSSWKTEKRRTVLLTHTRRIKNKDLRSLLKSKRALYITLPNLLK